MTGALGPGPVVRATDPDTSRAAAASLPPEVLTAKRLSVLEVIAASPGGATAFEVTARLRQQDPNVQQSVVARRCTDLHTFGLIDDTEQRRTGAYGRQLIVWAATSPGLEALARQTAEVPR